MAGLDKRKLAILKLVVERYIETGEPVGSKAISEALDRLVSSATIRNDMASLEKLGYLEQPHTSAGRVPSYKGYRLYISQLMQREPLSEADREKIDRYIIKGDLNPKTLVSNATDLLAELTDCIIVSTSGAMDFSIITRVDVIPAGRRLYAILMITSSGAVENRVCRLEIDLHNEQIEFFVRFIRENLIGLRVEDLTEEKIVELGLALGAYTMALAPLLYGVYDISNKLRQAQIEVKNERSLIARGDFQLQHYSQFVQQQERLEEVLRSAFQGINVVFGDDHDTFAVTNSSLVFSSFRQGDRPIGAFGVLGPMRLDYGRIIPYIEYLSETLTRLLTEGYDDDRSKPSKPGTAKPPRKNNDY